MAKRIKASDLDEEKKALETETDETTEPEVELEEEIIEEEEEAETENEQLDPSDTSLREENLHYYVAGFNDRLIATTIDVLCLLPIMYLINLIKPASLTLEKMNNMTNAFLTGSMSVQQYEMERYEYIIENNGWMLMLGGTLFDTVILMAIIVPIWAKYQATPGKMLFGMRIVDAETFGPITGAQSFKRSLGYMVSSIPLAIGFLAIAFNRDKQGWHDRIADTYVLYKVPHDDDWKDRSFKRQTKFALVIIVCFALFLLYKYQIAGTPTP